jgi:hypothetical protein
MSIVGFETYELTIELSSKRTTTECVSGVASKNY